MESAIFQFMVTFEFIRCPDNCHPQHFDFGIEYKPNDWNCRFLYPWLEIFRFLKEEYIESSEAF